MWKPRLPGVHWLFFVMAIYMLVFVQATEVPSKDIIALVFLALCALLYVYRRVSCWRQRRRERTIDHHLRRALDHDAPHPPEGI